MKRKVLLCLFFLLLFSFVMSSFSLAYVLDFDDYTVDTSSIELYDYFFLCKQVISKVSYYYIYTYTDANKVTFTTKYEGSSKYFEVHVQGKAIKYQFNTSSKKFEVKSKSDNMSSYFSIFPENIFFSNYDIKDDKGSVFFPNNLLNNVKITNWEEIVSGSFSFININTQDDSIVSDEIDLVVNEYYPQYIEQIGDVYYKSKSKMFSLNENSQFLSQMGRVDGTNSIFSIPLSSLMILNSNYEYEFIIRVNDEEVFNKSFILGQVSAEDKKQQEKDKQLELQEEQNKTSKGIFDSIKELISFLNPASEKFFVYQLINLLIDAIKSLFIPSEDFLNDWVTDLNEWLSDRLGILYYPVDLVVTFLEKIGEISESGSAVISWGNFNFMGADLIKAGSYNLNELVSNNETLTNVHSIYLVFTDVILWIGLLFLAKNTFVDIFGGKYDDFSDIIETGVESNFSNERSYKKYEMYQANKQRYKMEHSRRRNK